MNTPVASIWSARPVFGLGAVAVLCLLAAPAGAFWERSRFARCSEAATPAEIVRFRCEEFALPPPPLLGHGRYFPGATSLSPAPPPQGEMLLPVEPRLPIIQRGHVVRRLG